MVGLGNRPLLFDNIDVTTREDALLTSALIPAAPPCVRTIISSTSDRLEDKKSARVRRLASKKDIQSLFICSVT